MRQAQMKMKMKMSKWAAAVVELYLHKKVSDKNQNLQPKMIESKTLGQVTVFCKLSENIVKHCFAV